MAGEAVMAVASAKVEFVRGEEGVYGVVVMGAAR
jgi:hypothetical protein